ncbi:GLCE-like protein [Mya arenaria]|uniref:heparosan-N-sulfate-glucuronate 5-epimerase n=1 Tax=Mya arenaria TaxID=6604 RepID=A0ABY7EXB2_MYAAR|nr:D-glucuronyl C5-epimerase-like [Mya arenaria]XP_052820785.1 D-glucuronyl C5-epimerase-like [Mya arenaria]XP_052820786.1 D-glucuronyl C5-epimerase-like [Mya arenaria]XP_052820787.1 D-glucuronyl C5-epimerase-like [Mya arenaria]XP_052820788.1 D-glucuronyl C5-epimerase-like [Mya arenaria]WAR14505.1 GLCE-like protein [Mya arenaria]
MKKSLGSCATIMRVNPRRAFVFLIVLCTCILSFSFWSRCPLNDQQQTVRESSEVQGSLDQSVHFRNRNANNYDVPAEMEMAGGGSSMHEITCEINHEYSVQCRREENEVYMPFSFIKKYFEVYGEIQVSEGDEKFEFSHSYSEVHVPPEVIRPDGIFMSFEHYNVEIRKRVKCITATEGVPVSTQWEASGHFYPIQIAQFGLSHYSKHLVEGKPTVTRLITGNDLDLDLWAYSSSKTTARSLFDRTRQSDVIQFKTSDSLSNTGLQYELKEKNNFAVTLDFKMISNGSVTASLKSDTYTFHIHYVFSNTLISCDGRNIFFGLGENRRGKWIHLARDVNMDLLKGLALKCSKHRKMKDLTFLGLSIRGQGWVDNVTLASAAHMDHFFDAANWFVNHQDSRGGWPIKVTRKLLSGVMELPPGWYSAMAQGQAMSTLVRAYLRSGSKVYLQAATDALKIFEISSAQGGVKARFANSYDWYEEYPTTPSSFVLNGFIFSLFGLYDLKQVAEGQALETVTRIYNEGIKSLKAMLLMYDSGTGTFYDLRHITVGIAPNRARWDYHTVHISQLLQLSRMEDDPLFMRTAKRWQDYMQGKWSTHN